MIRLTAVAARLAVVVCAAAAPALRAGQPLVTDDAAIVAPKTCQLEAWTHSTDGGHEYWVQPACNFTGNLELAVGGARMYPFDGPVSNVIQLQAKTVLFPRADGSQPPVFACRRQN